MAPPNSAASKKAAKAGPKKIPISKSGTRMTTKKTGDKVIKKKTGKKAKQMMIKGGLEGGAKASAGGVAAFDLEAFVKVKFSDLEKTAHQKKVSQMLLSQCSLPCFRTCLGRPTALWLS